MKLPWLPDNYHLRLLQLIDQGPPPFVPPAAGQMCGIKWCVALADSKSGWPVEGPRLMTADDFRHRNIGTRQVYSTRCQVHRVAPDYRPRERKYNLGRLYVTGNRATRRRKAA